MPVAGPADEPSPAGMPTGLDRRFEIAVDGLIGAYDLSANVAVQAHIAQVLARVGVERVEVASGAAFDPAIYEAVSTVATDDPHRFQRVAATLRPGWRRLDAIVRTPQVSVWVADPKMQAGAVMSDG
jgi:hypothetical protein